MSARYVAVISASAIWKYEVRFFDGEPRPYRGDAEKFGWVNKVYSSGHDHLWQAKRAARKKLKQLDRMDRLNRRLEGASESRLP